MDLYEARVGVFMRVYRNEPEMHKAIQSVLNQTYANLRYYVMVNNETKPIVLDYARKDTRIEIIDGGLNDGFRTAAKYIARENRYVTTIDADDWYDESYIAELVQYAEEKNLDIVACGNYFVQNGQIKGIRNQLNMQWNVFETSEVLPYIYGHCRTIWGKMVKADVLLKTDFDILPKTEEYGGYGGDTILIFHLFESANRIGICNKVLYYYRMSNTSGSYKLGEGRLEADEVVFCYVENVLNKISELGELQHRFLLWVYGNALLDTTQLLMNCPLSEKERVEKLLYIYRKELTQELFLREKQYRLTVPAIDESSCFRRKCCQKIFNNISIKVDFIQSDSYYEIFNEICGNIGATLQLDELILLSRDNEMLDIVLEKKYMQLFDRLLNHFSSLNMEEKNTCVSLLRKLTKDAILLLALQNGKFVSEYIDLIQMLYHFKYEEIFESLKGLFAEKELPDGAETLVEIWINAAAFNENTNEFILAKQFKVDVLLKLEKYDEAQIEYKDLEQMGISDENMEYLEKCLKSI